MKRNHQYREFWPLFTSFAVIAVLFSRNYHFWNLYSVNVLYWDQWDFWVHMFNDESSLWDMYDHQHGPHKMGVGYFYIYLVANLSDWDLRMESLSMLFVSLGTTGAFLWLKYRMFGKWHYMDAVIPFATMSFVHYEIYYIGTNPALNVFPLLLIVSIGLALTFSNYVLRYIALVVLGFFATYTGFAIFAGLLVPVYCLAEVIRSFSRNEFQERRWIVLSSFIFSSVGFASFFFEYTFRPAVAGFKFPHDQPWEYLEFLSKYWAYFFNMGRIGTASVLTAVVVLSLTVFVVWRCLRSFLEENSLRRTSNNIVAFLVLFSVVYSMNTAVGRISIGVNAGMTSRYLVFLVPLWIGCYFVLLQQGRRIAIVSAAALLGLILYGDQTFQSSRERELSNLARNKTKWVEAYLEHRSILKANEVSKFVVYPFGRAYNRQEGYIEKMEKENLGFLRK